MTSRFPAVFALFASLAAFPLAAGASQFVVSNIDPATYGQQCDQDCSAGRYSATQGASLVVFTGMAGNLVQADGNGKSDVFVRDRASGTTRLVSRLADGSSADGDSRYPAISRNGDVIAFVSDADELVPGDSNGFDDVYALNVATGTLVRASNREDGSTATLGAALADRLSMSDDGRFLAFATSSALTSSGGPLVDVFVRDLVGGSIELVSRGPDGSVGVGSSWHPTISPDARWVAFESNSTNWVPPAGQFDETPSLFLRDRQTGTTRLVANYNAYLQYPVAFGGGRMLFTVGALSSSPFARGMTCGLGMLDLATGVATRIPTPPVPANVDCVGVDLSSDGLNALVRTSAAWDPRDTNGGPDLYRLLVSDGTGELVSARQDATAFSAGFSGFVPGSTDVVLTALSRTVVPGDTNELLDAFLLGSGVRERISVGSEGPWPGTPSIDGFDTNPMALDLSPDGRFALYWTNAPNAFLDDRPNASSLAWVDTTQRHPRYVGLLPDGSPSYGVKTARVSADGATVAFLGRDASDRRQAYIVPSTGGASVLVSTDSTSGSAGDLALSDDARFVLYSREFAPGDSRRLLVRLDRTTGQRLTLSRNTFAAAMSADGSVVVFAEEDGTFTQVREWRPDAGTVALVSRDRNGNSGNGYSSHPAISDDGRVVAFETCAPNLARQPAGDGSCPIVRGPLGESQWMRVELSLPSDPVTVFLDHSPIELSRTGRFLAVSTSMLVDPDAKIWYVSFARHDAQSDQLDHLFAGGDGATPFGWGPRLSADGRSVLVTTLGTPVATGDRNGTAADVVLWRDDQAPLFDDGFD